MFVFLMENKRHTLPECISYNMYAMFSEESIKLLYAFYQCEHRQRNIKVLYFEWNYTATALNENFVATRTVSLRLVMRSS